MTNIPLLHREPIDRGLVAGTIAIVCSWLYFNRAQLQWLATSLSDISLFNGVMLVAGGLLLAFLGWRYRRSIEVAPGLHRLPLVLMLGCGAGSIATHFLP